MRRALRRAQAPLDSGSWNLWAVGLGVRAAPGFWMLESVGGLGRCGPPGFWILDTGNWAVGGSRGVGRPDSVFCKLETGLSEGGSTGVGRPDSGFWILETGAVEGGRAARILYSAFCILLATCACDVYMHVRWNERGHMCAHACDERAPSSHQ